MYWRSNRARAWRSGSAPVVVGAVAGMCSSAHHVLVGHAVLRDEDHDPLHQVAELAHVALPGQLHQQVDGARRQALGLDAVLDAGQAQEVLGQLRDVLAARAQRRHGDA